MTSASELFYNRRSRASRSVETRLGIDGLPSDRDRLPIRRSFLRRRRNHLANGEDMESSLRPRALLRSGHEPRHSNDIIPGDSGSISNGSIAGDSIDRMLSASDGQLSTSVLQARARLLERLRGISIPLNRQQDEAASSVPWDDEYWAVVVGRRNSVEPGRQASSSLRQAQSPLVGRTRSTSLRGARPTMGSSGAPPHELASFGDLVERVQSHLLDFGAEESRGFPLPQYCMRRSPGLGCDEIQSLLHEIFEEDEDGDVGMQQCDCSVCLESFEEGDGLLRLHCGHRFHAACLEPWLRICADCPYCRARI